MEVEPRYRYQDQGGEYEVTRSEILKEYFPWWIEQMRKAGKADLISEDRCVEDFCVVHWAWKIE